MAQTGSWSKPAPPPHLKSFTGTKEPGYHDLSRTSIEGYGDIANYFREGAFNVGMTSHQDPQVRNLADADATAGIRAGERAKSRAIAAGGEGSRARGDMMALAGAQGGYQMGQERALDFRKYLTGLDERNVGRRLEGAQTLFNADMTRRQFNEQALDAYVNRQQRQGQVDLQREILKKREQNMAAYMNHIKNRPDASKVTGWMGYNRFQSQMQKWLDEKRAYEALMGSY